MFGLKSLLTVALVSVVAALPTLEVRAATTCGSTSYTAAQVSAAAAAACNYVKSGTTAGSSTYPHQYNNYEGFNFAVAGPWQEFPILKSGVYTGGENLLIAYSMIHTNSIKGALGPTVLSSTSLADLPAPSPTLAPAETTLLAAPERTRGCILGKQVFLQGCCVQLYKTYLPK